MKSGEGCPPASPAVSGVEEPLKIVLITPGTGSYYCGVCMRDNALAKALIGQGHDAIMLPMYLPLTLDETSAASGAPIFFGGINVYLQQKFAAFRHTPAWLDKLFNHPALLKFAGSRSGMTGGAQIGELTHSMLLGEEGKQAKELEKLVSWLETHERPDAIWLSSALLVGLARRLKEALGIPVLCSLQGEDTFLDGIVEPWRSRCWAALAERARDVDRFIAPSRFFAQSMGGRMQIPDERLRVIANGISLEGFVPRSEPPARPTIGFLGRMIEAKGLELVVDAFILLKQHGAFPNAVLHCAGAMTAGDEIYVGSLKARLAAAGCLEDVEFFPNVSRERKIEILSGLSLLSVPATASEAFGLYVIEALAAGVPVVQPRAWAYPELIETTGGGLLCEPQSAQSLASAWSTLLADPVHAHSLGQRGRAAVEREYQMELMARRFIAHTREIMDAEKALH